MENRECVGEGLIFIEFRFVVILVVVDGVKFFVVWLKLEFIVVSEVLMLVNGWLDGRVLFFKVLVKLFWFCCMWEMKLILGVKVRFLVGIGLYKCLL